MKYRSSSFVVRSAGTLRPARIPEPRAWRLAIAVAVGLLNGAHVLEAADSGNLALDASKIVDVLRKDWVGSALVRDEIAPILRKHGVSFELINQLGKSQGVDEKDLRKWVRKLRQIHAEDAEVIAREKLLVDHLREVEAAHQDVAEKARNAATSAEADGVQDPGATETKKDVVEAHQTAKRTISEISSMEGSDSMWRVLVWTGAKLQNPYSFSTNAAGARTLSSNNSSTDGFIDLQLLHRFVLSKPGESDPVFFGNPRRQHEKWDWFLPGQVFPDVDFRFGYVFGGSSAPTNLSITTIPGGSDVYSDNGIGLPIWRWNRGGWNQQATIELAGGFVTDRKFLALHPNYFFGAGYQIHGNGWTWFTRFGLGGAHVPVVGEGNIVKLDSRGFPDFEMRSAPTWGTVVSYHFGNGFSFQLGANAYMRSQPTWNVSAGISVNPAAIFGAFSPKK